MILKQFISKREDTVSEDISIKEAINLMTKRSLRYLVFLDEQKPCGILTERDILKLLHKGLDYEQNVKEVYTKNLIQANGERTLEYSLSLMVDYSIRRIIVINSDGIYLGSIEQEEIVHQLETENFNKSLKVYEVMQMASPAIIMSKEESLKNALNKMVKEKIGSVLVGDDKPIGILTESDILRLANDFKEINIKLKDVMQTPLVIVHVEDEVEQVLSLMKQKNIRRIVISDNSLKHFVISTRDILNNLRGSYSKFLETKLHANRTMFDNLSELMFEVFDLDGDYVIGWANSQAKKLLNINIDDTILDVLPNKLWDETIKAFDEKKDRVEEFVNISGKTYRYQATISSVMKTRIIKVALNDINKIHRLNLELHEKIDYYQLGMQKQLLLYNETFNQDAIGIVYVAKDGKILNINPYMENMLGFSNEEIEGKNVLDITHPEDKKSNKRIFKNLFKEITNKEKIEKRYLCKDGSYIWGELTLSPSKNENGEIKYFVAFVQNITKRKEALDELKEEYKRQLLAQSVFDHTAEGIIITDKNKKITAVNPSFTTITGYEFEEINGRKPTFLTSKIHKKSFFIKMWKDIKKQGKWTGEIWNNRKNGEVYPQLLTITQVKDSNNKILNYIGVFSDITQMKQTEQELEFMAHHDPLTNLPNRLLLEARLGHAIEWAKRDEFAIAVLFIDLDHFKEINDTFGHSTGDNILKQVASRFKGLLREKDTIARIGGDEFIVVVENFDSIEGLEGLIERIIDVFKKPFYVKKRQFKITCSIGTSIYPQNGTSIEELIKNADAAMYKAKAEGRNKNHFYTETLTDDLYEKMIMVNELRMAVEFDKIVLYYQPKIDMKTKKCVGLEALARWSHPVKGSINPEYFISLAEELSIIEKLGKNLLIRACKNIKRWQDDKLCPENWTLAVNVSAMQIQRSDFYETVKTVIRETGINPKLLELELTESCMMKNPRKTIELFKKLKSLGLTISMDDFGTGYSSLSYLKQFPIDRVKIDKSFITDIPHDNDDVAIAKAILALSKSLGLDVVAEGVENDLQEMFLLQEGCRVAQGFKYLRPVRLEEIEMFLMGERY